MQSTIYFNDLNHDIWRVIGNMQDNLEIEITPWKMRAYDFYSRVEEYQKTNE